MSARLHLSAASSGRPVSSRDCASYDSEAEHGHGHNQRRYRQLQWKDVWHAMRTEKHFDLAHWMNVSILLLVDQLMSKSGVLLALLATGLIGYIAYVSLFMMLPIVAEMYSLWWWWNVFFGVFLLGAIYFNYCMAVFTPAGSASDIAHGADKIYAFTAECPDIATMHAAGLLKVCKKCTVVKPPRSHHCRVCRGCTLKMDHHCPWINNCVGFGNYRYFVSFMFYVWLATFYIAAVLTPYAWAGGSLSDQIVRVLGQEMGPRGVLGDLLRAPVGPVGPVGPEGPQPLLVLGQSAREASGGSRRQLQAAGPLPKGVDRSRIVHLSDDTPPLPVHVVHATAPVLSALEQPESGSTSVQAAGRAGSGPARSGALPAPTAAAATAAATPTAATAAATAAATTAATAAAAITTTVATANTAASAAAAAAVAGHIIGEGKVLVLWCVCLGLVLSVGGLCCFHLYLISHNLTTLELFAWFGISKAEALVWRNPYDTGSRLRNFRAVFGDGPWYVVLLPSLRKPPLLKVSAYLGPGGNAWDGSWVSKEFGGFGGEQV